jgi:hypothetical protein
VSSPSIPIPLLATYKRAYNLAFDHAKRREKATPLEPWPLAAEDRCHATIAWMPDDSTYRIELRSEAAVVAAIHYDPVKNRMKFLGFSPEEGSR